MSYKRNGLRALGLSLIAMAGLMAIMAASASALWLEDLKGGLGQKPITANKLVEASTHVEGKLFVKEETELEILCSVIEASDLLLIVATSEASGKVNFKTCKTWQGGKDVSANCKPVEPISASGKAKLLLHEISKSVFKNYVLFEPAVAGGNFAVIKFPETCALPESNNVKGSLVAECLTTSLAAADCATPGAIHLLQPNEALFTGDKLTYGANKAATLKGVVSTKLTSGNEWAGHV